MGMKGYPEAVISEILYADIRRTFLQGLMPWNRWASSVPRQQRYHDIGEQQVHRLLGCEPQRLLRIAGV